MRTKEEMQAALKKAIEYYRLASRSGSKTSEANALMTLVAVSHEILMIGGTTFVDPIAVINGVCETEMDLDEVGRTVEYITGVTNEEAVFKDLT